MPGRFLGVSQPTVAHPMPNCALELPLWWRSQNCAFGRSAFGAAAANKPTMCSGDIWC